MATITDRNVRSLVALEKSASTARVLNLLAAHAKAEEDPEVRQAPMFQNPLLDQSIIVKHRIRPHEQEMFDGYRSVTTKVLLPIDRNDLKLGARAIQVGQKRFDQQAEYAFGDSLKPGGYDRQVLELMDALPSLDPFLLREHLKRHGVSPARAYFNIHEADIERMSGFVEAEVGALVARSVGKGGSAAGAARLVGKLLSNTPDTDLEPLRQTLRLSEQEYLDGIFAWRGFLYYKWVLDDLTPAVERLMLGIETIQPRGQRDAEAAVYIAAARPRIIAALSQTCDAVKRMLRVYDSAFGELTREGEPGGFRDFLLAAPDQFMRLGERLGAVQHMVSFWRYRFWGAYSPPIAPDELMDLFVDFEEGLAFSPETSPREAFI